MRRILVDCARSRRRAKRDPGAIVPLNEAMDFAAEDSAVVIALDDALDALVESQPRR